MLRASEVPLGALLPPYQVAPGALCQYSYEFETSEERSSDEHYDGPGQLARLANSGSRSWAVTSSASRGVFKNSAVAYAAWVPSFLAATYFQPCERHRHHKKNECTFFCITCGTKPYSVCQHCMGAHAGHQVIQVRRYVYCDVVRACDITPFVDASGVQNYIINSAKVMFLNHRPHSKIGRANGVDTCRTCRRHLREGFSYCSLACKVEALTQGEMTSAAGSDTAPRVTASEAVAAATVTTAAQSPRALPTKQSPSFSPRPVLTSAVPRSSFAAATTAAAALNAPLVSSYPDLAAATATAAASCAAALSSDLESSEPGEDTFLFGSGRMVDGGNAAAKRRPAPALALPPPGNSWSFSYSSTSRGGAESFADFNFENPPKRRRSCHITRRPSTSDGYETVAANYPPQSAATAAAANSRRASVDSDVADAAAAAETLLMPFRTASSGLVPAAPAAPPSTAVTAEVPCHLASTVPTASCFAELSRAASSLAVLSSRRKQQAPQRAPSF